ncbi:DUF5011 domain-containing protein [Listeria innocua]|uniref:immunoglobulin-like domain-containing protein n=1 Tax=Listeria innocua TaxID=1642 RepID=UPI0016278F18|nr:immunoglobulin-like domain-containing protein [Listeria innocua]MBC2137517.1 DUF5011 domain-containing protein [Listeria innocua]
MEKKKRSKKTVPYTVVSSLAVILVAGSIYAYTGMNNESTKKDSTPKTTMNDGKGSKATPNTNRKDGENTNPTLGAVMAKVEEKAATTGVTRSAVVANSPVKQILQTLTKVPDKAPVLSEVATVTPTILLPDNPKEENTSPGPVSPEIPIVTPTPPTLPEGPSGPVTPEETNEVPTIYAENQEISIGSVFNASDYATASDEEDGDITSAIQVTANNVNNEEEGSYQVTYHVVDSHGAWAEKTITVTVTNERPVITATDQSVSLDASFDPLENVSAYDAEEGDITTSIHIVSNNVDTATEGTYQVVYSVVDGYGKAAQEVTIQITVNNDLPIITATDKVILAGEMFDPLEEVTATDQQDGDLTSAIRILHNEVDTTTPGTYSVTYEVTDQNGGTATKTVIITVEAPQI